MTPIRFKNLRQLQQDLQNAPLQHYVPLLLTDLPIDFAPGAFHRVLQIGADTEAALLYGNCRHRLPGGRVLDHPVAPYQLGSVVDSFDFGSVVFVNTASALVALEGLLELLGNDPMPLDGGWYRLRLRLSVDSAFVHIPEYLYTVDRADLRKSGEKQFDYLRPDAAAMQAEYEQAFRSYLEHINARLLTAPERISLDNETEHFAVEASVVIPVRDRARTIGDAVRSALSQLTLFDYNVIVVDNGSTDGTSEVLAAFDDPRLVVLHPDPALHLGIGGCWNAALDCSECGRFVVQLDSDDLYADEHTLSRIVEKFHADRCGMVVGSYRMTDFDLNTLPPGVIDHREWTDRNGRHNALRVNGFGAPRAFYTPLARACRFPDVSYGEDYAMCLRISREYYVGRIYDPIYVCRRWEGNSDADLPQARIVEHQVYKDWLRSVEIVARIKLNQVEFPALFAPEHDDLSDLDDDFDDLDDWDDDWDDERGGKPRKGGDDIEQDWDDDKFPPF